ncbi:MAG: TRAP transporter small permease [Planctomycetota bacterium]|jgi:TRAP-type C4-dicarboxylate transport system permease small subunit|nr:TRAP transporter small permease [Planctomycetota bacterium]
MSEKETAGTGDNRERVGPVAALFGAAALFSVFLANLGVVTRYVLHYSLPSAEETLRYLFIWLIFVGAALSFGEGGLISITLLEESLAGRPRLCRALLLFQGAAFLVFSLVLTFTGWNMLEAQFEFSETSVVLEINMGWVTLGVVVGCALMALYSLRNLGRVLFGRSSGSGGNTA